MKHKLTPTQVYNLLVKYSKITGSTTRQANIHAVRYTWFYYNNQAELKQLTKDLP